MMVNVFIQHSYIYISYTMDTNTNTDTNTNLPNTLALSSQYFLEKSFLFPLHFIVLQGNCDPNCTSSVQKVNPGDL